jgi:hypothetical protein
MTATEPRTASQRRTDCQQPAERRTVPGLLPSIYHPICPTLPEPQLLSDKGRQELPQGQQIRRQGKSGSTKRSDSPLYNQWSNVVPACTRATSGAPHCGIETKRMAGHCSLSAQIMSAAGAQAAAPRWPRQRTNSADDTATGITSCPWPLHRNPSGSSKDPPTVVARPEAAPSRELC